MHGALRYGCCVLVLLCISTARATDATISEKTPSPDVSAPVPIDVGEVVKGRLADSSQTGKYHFWVVNLTPGNYKIVLDVRRADDNPASNIGGVVDWFSMDGVKLEQLLSINELDNRFRAIARLQVKKPLKRILRYSNSFTVSDYWLGVFRADSEISSPFFVRTPEVASLTLGAPVTSLVDGGRPFSRDAYYLIRLAPGDYKVSIEFRRSDGNAQSNVGGELRAMGADGDGSRQVMSMNDIGASGKRVTKLSLADSATMLLLCRAYFVPESAVLKVEPWVE